MKNIFILLVLLIFLSCKTDGGKKLVNVEPVRVGPPDRSEWPSFEKEFPYLDSILIKEITYLSDSLNVNGYLIQPKAQGKYPCIIYNRGGNQEFAKLDEGYAAWLGKLAKEGYVVIASQYRGNGGSQGQEEFGGQDVNDVLALIDVLDEVESADTDKIGMYGWSRGGMMTYLALTRTDGIKAAVVGGAPSDQHLSVINRPSLESNVHAQLIPNYDTNKDGELDKRSAVKWADKFPRDIPILMLHGNADWRVKSEHSLKLAFEFEKYRIPYRLIVFEGGDHRLREYTAEVENHVLQWFDKYLKEDRLLPNMEYHGD